MNPYRELNILSIKGILMRRTVFIVLVSAVLIAAGPASLARAAEFSSQDLEGKWSLHAFGVYDVKGVYYFGNLDLSQDGLITGGDAGAYGWSQAQITGGGLCLGADGEIGGVVEGLSTDRGAFWIAVKKGWMDLAKNQITFIASDDQEYQLLVTLVRVR